MTLSFTIVAIMINLMYCLLKTEKCQMDIVKQGKESIRDMIQMENKQKESESGATNTVKRCNSLESVRPNCKYFITLLMNTWHTCKWTVCEDNLFLFCYQILGLSHISRLKQQNFPVCDMDLVTILSNFCSLHGYRLGAAHLSLY